MSLELPDATWEIEDQLTRYVRKSKKYIHLTTPIPCTACDNGWMSDLESATKPILVPLIHGESSTLSPRDQITIAAWLVKTAMVYDLDAETRAPRPRYFEDDEFHTFRSALSFWPTYMFFLGAYNGNHAGIFQEDHSDFRLTGRDGFIPLVDSVRVYALTLAVKHLVLQICCAKLEPAIGHFHMKDFRLLCSQIAAPPPVDVRWPPPYAFDDGLINEFTRRWSDVPLTLPP